MGFHVSWVAESFVISIFQLSEEHEIRLLNLSRFIPFSAMALVKAVSFFMSSTGIKSEHLSLSPNPTSQSSNQFSKPGTTSSSFLKIT